MSSQSLSPSSRAQCTLFVVLAGALAAQEPEIARAKSLHWHQPVVLDTLPGNPTEFNSNAVGSFLHERVGECREQGSGYQVAVDGEDVIAVWTRLVDSTAANYDVDLYTAHRSPSGSWSSVRAIGPANDSDLQRFPAVAIDPSGIAHVVFVDHKSPKIIQHVSTTDFGATWRESTPTDLSVLPPGTTGVRDDLPTVHADPAGNVWAGWKRLPAISAGEFGYGQYAVLFSGAGTWKTSFDSLRFSVSTNESSWTCAPATNDCDEWDLHYLPTYAVNRPNMISDGSRVVWAFKDDPFRIEQGFNEWCQSTYCILGGRKDHIMYKWGVWDANLNSGAGRLAWWGVADSLEGSDVRTCWRQLEVDNEPGVYPQRAGVTSHFPAMVQTPNGDVYVFWLDEVAYGSTPSALLGGNGTADIWFRKWSGNGTVKGGTVYPVSRTALVGTEYDFMDDTGEPRAAADLDGWVHVVYSRTPTGILPPGPGPSEAIQQGPCSRGENRGQWQDEDVQVAYATHHQSDADDEWGWEYSISAAPGAARYPSVATDQNGSVHVLWTQYDPADYPAQDNDNLDVAYRHGEVLPDSVMPGEHALWDNLVFLDQDFVVAASGTLEVAPGTTVLAQANYDHRNLGVDAGRVELIVRGTLIAEGDSANPIVFKSTKDSTSGEWYGIRWENGAVGTTPDNSVSSVSFAEFDAPVFAMGVDSLSGNIIDCSFTDSQSGDIYMDRDTRIPEGYQWLLNAPTEVVAANTDASPDTLGGEDPLKVEMLVNGALATGDPNGTGSRVLFRSETADDFTGDGWYGAIIQGTGWNDQVGIAAIDSAEFRDARYPVSLFLAWSASVTNSWFHHYNKTAITDWASDATIVGNEIWRGDGMDDTPGANAVGRIGIHIASSFGAYHDNKVFHQAARGIWADFSSGWCTLQAQGSSPRTLTIRDNDVAGDRSGPTTSEIVGINVSWACRERNVIVTDNNVRDWPGVGIRVRQSSDAIVKCNCMVGNDVGFHHRRDALGFSGPDGAEGHNYLQESLLQDNQLSNVHSQGKGPGNGSSGFYGYLDPLGGNSSHKGSRVELSDFQNALNWSLTAFEVGLMDTAQANAWFDDAGTHLTDSSSPTINDLNFWEPAYTQAIEVGSWEGSTFTVACAEQAGSDCGPISPPSGGARAFGGQRPHAEQAGREPEGTPVPGEPEFRPAVFSLLPPRPNPARGVVEFWFDVPWDGPTGVEVDVYDVAGRRVKRVLGASRPVGRHVVSWNLRNEEGGRVSPGIYFARIVARGEAQSERITVLR